MVFFLHRQTDFSCPVVHSIKNSPVSLMGRVILWRALCFFRVFRRIATGKPGITGRRGAPV